ncbi:unnamed protein product [Effrenium voratum]|uniref:Uncharacterized protein n=1 Tax=Effrenium voratum TaxID=2562239 RepID=A0AA36N618_9DINO|nr:unnamed protein product [Effrenium voratum]
MQQARAADEASHQKQREAASANERLATAKRKAEEVSAASQKKQKQVLDLREEAERKMKEAEAAEAAAMEAAMEAERYKEYVAEAEQSVQEASVSAAQCAKEVALAMQQVRAQTWSSPQQCRIHDVSELVKVNQCLLPAIGVGAAVYFVTGFASISTLGLVGVGAGVGYGVGSWIADKMGKKQDAQKVPLESLPWAVQVALQNWQEFLTRQAAGRQLSPADVDAIWAQFEQYEPTHAANARALVRGSSASSSSQGPATFNSGGGPTFVATQAAEV